MRTEIKVALFIGRHCTKVWRCKKLHCCMKFRDVNNKFMKELEHDKKKIKSSMNIFCSR